MVIDGTKIAHELELRLTKKLKGLPPKKVVFILFGDDFASKKFMQMKEKVAKRLGIGLSIFEREATTTEEALLFIGSLINEYDGIVVQLPIPRSLDSQKILNAIPIEKDIDLLSEQSMISYKSGENDHIPPVARAVFKILQTSNTDLKNKKILILGNGKLVGMPVAAMFDREKNSYKQVDKDTPESETFLEMKSADIIISGIGVPHFIKPDMIKEGAIVIDAGTSEQMGILAGDADPNCAEKCFLFTPVPSGVGPITIISLFWNLHQ